jgi:hypothetical protein
MPIKKDPTNFTITVHIPEALGKRVGLTQEILNEYQSQFTVEVQGTIGTQTPKIIILADDAPTNDY